MLNRVVDCFMFGCCRLKDYPQYCRHLASIPHFAQFPAHLKQVCVGLDGDGCLNQVSVGFDEEERWLS